MKLTAFITATLLAMTVGLSSGARAEAASCTGDCDGSNQVTINELLVGVNIALGNQPVSACMAFDANGDDQVTINELLTAVNSALNGCPVPADVLQAQRVTTAPTGIDDPLWDSVPAFVPTLDNRSTNLRYGDGQLNMTGTFGGLATFNGGNPAELQLRAVHDGQNLYILAQWNDTVFNLDRRRWLYDGPTDPLKPNESTDGWTSQLNDDKIAFAFEIEPTRSEFGTFADVGCQASCHNLAAPGEPLDLDMRPAEGKVDIWHWKTSRSEPLGYVDDQVTSPDPGRMDDAGLSIEHRNRAAGATNRSGPVTEWDGSLQEFTRWDGQTITLDPAYIILDGHRMPFEGDAAAGDMLYQSNCAVCHGNAGQGGIGPALTSVAFTRDSRAELDEDIAVSSHPGAGSYNSLSEQEKTDVLARLRGFSGIPGYYLTQPEGSVADIVTQSNVDYTQVDDITRVSYRVLIMRALATGNDDDAQFTPGNDYTFGVALMDNDGRNHIGSRKQILSIAP
ncbi:MAG: ethylbenzene dehydrogenase-related protein [Candidatus Binatia bacterium]